MHVTFGLVHSRPHMPQSPHLVNTRNSKQLLRWTGFKDLGISQAKLHAPAASPTQDKDQKFTAIFTCGGDFKHSLGLARPSLLGR